MYGLSLYAAYSLNCHWHHDQQISICLRNQEIWKLMSIFLENCHIKMPSTRRFLETWKPPKTAGQKPLSWLLGFVFCRLVEINLPDTEVFN